MSDLGAFQLPADLDTPALVVDIGRVRANVARLQVAMDARRVALRPHVKTHKSVRVGRIQLDGGASGLTVGTLGEAAVFVAAGITDLFVAYPIRPTGPKAARLRELHDAAPALAVGLDSVAGAAPLAAAVAGGRHRLRVLVEVDPGDGRTGVVGAAAAADVAHAARSAGLDVVGVFAHGGHGYRPGASAAAGTDEVRTLTEAAGALEVEGFDVQVVSAGSTPTMISAAAGRVTEIRAGTYALGDRQQWLLGAIPAEGCAAIVVATTVSAFANRVVLDAGAKSLTKDRADWIAGHGHMPAYPDLVIERLSDYHAVVPLPNGVVGPRLGEQVAIVPNHVCPVVDLFDSFLAVHTGGPGGHAEVWPVDARGRSR